MLADKTGMRKKEDVIVKPARKIRNISDEELNARFGKIAESEDQKIDRIRNKYLNKNK